MAKSTVKTAAVALGTAANVKSITTGHNVLSTALSTILGPLVLLIEKRNSFGDTAGHEVGVLRDEPLRIMLDSFCRDAYRQAYGIYNPATNKINANSKQRLDEAEQRAAQLFRKYETNPEAINADPGFDFVSSQVLEADTRHAAYLEILDGFKSIYKALFNIDWKYEAYVPRTTTKAETTSAVERMKAIAPATVQPQA